MFNFNQYEISESDIRKLEHVSQTDGYLQILRMNSDWSSLLERKARIREAMSSIGIEGTVLSLDQAKAITVGEKDVTVGEKEKREFVGYYESLEYIREKIDEDLSVSLLLKIHEKITHGDKESNPGKIRNDLRSIKSKGSIIYTAPHPSQLDTLIREFIAWFNKVSKDKNFSPVIAAAICHFWFVWIHPFCDGNGRVSRLLTTFLLLKKKSEGIRYFALSDYYNNHKDSYYDALEEVNICNPKNPAQNFNNDLSSWLSYFIDSYLFQMRQIKEVANRILQLNIRVDHLRDSGLITESHNKVLSFLSSREKASYNELIEHLSVSKQRVHQILQPLRDANILVEEQIGPNKWFKLGSPESDPDETLLKKPVKKKLKTKKENSEKVNDRAVQGQLVLPIFDVDS